MGAVDHERREGSLPQICMPYPASGWTEGHIRGRLDLVSRPTGPEPPADRLLGVLP